MAPTTRAAPATLPAAVVFLGRYDGLVLRSMMMNRGLAGCPAWRGGTGHLGRAGV